MIKDWTWGDFRWDIITPRIKLCVFCSCIVIKNNYTFGICPKWEGESSSLRKDFTSTNLGKIMALVLKCIQKLVHDISHEVVEWFNEAVSHK